MALAQITGDYRAGQPAKGSQVEADLEALQQRVNDVTTEQIHAGAVTSSKLAAGAVNTTQLADGALSADATGRGKMADSFLTTPKIDDLAVTLAKVALGAVDATKLAANSGIVQAVAGTYTGNGTTTNAIVFTTPTFMPDMVTIVASGLARHIIGMRAEATMDLGPLHDTTDGNLDDAIQYDSGGFTLKKSSSASANQNGQVYFYWAQKAY